MAEKFSYSRIQTYNTCPRKHKYCYVEGIRVPENYNTIPGKLFHKCCELYLECSKDPSKMPDTYERIQEIYEEFDMLAATGKIKLEPGLLKYIFELYLYHYKERFEEETTILVEYEFQETLEDGDIFVGTIDEIYSYKGMTILRDRKTSLSKLKYTYDDVKFNQQLLVYLPFGEDKLGLKIDAIEIDEVRFAKLQEVPLIKNGTPTKDKNKLDLVTYEAYYNKLCEMCLEDEKEYKSILEYLAKRGHPLFNRIRVQILEDRIINSNAQDILDMYKSIKLSKDNGFRSRSILCNYCEYRELCNLDMESPDEDLRTAVIEKLLRGE